MLFHHFAFVAQVDEGNRLEALHEAGMPPGVVQFVPGVAEECGRVLTQSPDLAALHFTGSTATFNHLWRSISANISKYNFTDCREVFFISQLVTFFQLPHIPSHCWGDRRKKFPFHSLVRGCRQRRHSKRARRVRIQVRRRFLILRVRSSRLEFSGQKCSATSRMYVPQSLWPRIKDQVSLRCSVHRRPSEYLRHGPSDVRNNQKPCGWPAR